MAASVSLNGISLGLQDSVTGTTGTDTLQFLSAGSITIFAIESVLGSKGIDEVTIGSMGNFGSVSISGIESLTGAAGFDQVIVNDIGKNSTSYLTGVEQITMNTDGTLRVIGAQTVIGSADHSEKLYLLSTSNVAVADIDVVNGTTNDVVTMLTPWALDINHIASVIGSDGIDNVRKISGTALYTANVETVILTTSGSLKAVGVETVRGTSGGTDTVTLLSDSTVSMSGIESVVGSSGHDAITLTQLGDVANSTYLTNVEQVNLQTSGHLDVRSVLTVIGNAATNQSINLLGNNSSISVKAIETIVGGGTNETVTMLGAGAMTVSGIETLFGSAGIDIITLATAQNIAVAKVDSLIGSSGNDSVSLLCAGAISVMNVESVTGSGGADSVSLLTTATIAVSGIDTLIGTAGNDVVQMLSSGNLAIVSIDTVFGSSGQDRLFLQTANPLLISAFNIESVIGSSGADNISFSNGTNHYASGVESISLTLAGQLSVSGSAGIYDASGGVSTVTLLTSGNYAVSYIETVIGSAGNDSLMINQMGDSVQLFASGIEHFTFSNGFNGGVLSVDGTVVSVIGNMFNDNVLVLRSASNVTITSIETVIGSSFGDTVNLAVTQDIFAANVDTVIGTAGTELLTMLCAGSLAVSSIETIVGSSGMDSVSLLTTQNLSIAGVETVIGTAGSEVLTLLCTGMISIAAIDTVFGSSGVDALTMLTGGVLRIRGIETVIGSAFSDRVNLLTTANLAIAAVDSVVGTAGAETLSLLSATDVSVQSIETVLGSSGVDTVRMLGASTLFVVNVESVVGSAGTDLVNLLCAGSVAVDHVETVLGSAGVDVVSFVNGGDLSVINVESVWGSVGTDIVRLGITQNIALGQVDTVIGTGGSGEMVTLLTSTSVAISLIETVTGSGGVDTVRMLDSGTVLTVSGVESVIGSGGADALYKNGNAPLYARDVEYVYLNSGGAVSFANALTIQASNGGIDSVTMLCAQTVQIAGVETMIGSAGIDTVNMFGVGDVGTFTYFAGVETINWYGYGGVISVDGASTQINGSGYADQVVMRSAGAIATSLIDSIAGTSGTDTVTLLDGGYFVTVSKVESVIGSSATDYLIKTGNTALYTSDVENITLASGGNVTALNVLSVNGSNGAVDTLTLLSGGTVTVSGVETVIGSSGNDTLDIFGAGDVGLFTKVSNVEQINWSGYGGTLSIDSATSTVVGSAYSEILLMRSAAAISTGSIDSIVGTSGTDTVTLLDGGFYVTVNHVESVIGSAATDYVIKISNDKFYARDVENLTLASGGSVAVYNVGSIGGSNSATDIVTLLTGGSLTVTGLETLIGSSFVDTVNVYGFGDVGVTSQFSGIETINLFGYGGTLSVDAQTQTVIGSGYSEILSLRSGATVAITAIESVAGSTATDTVTLLEGNSGNLLVTNVETVLGSSAGETVFWQGGSSLAIASIRTVAASGAVNNTLQLLTASSVSISGVESVIGSNGIDAITITSAGDFGTHVYLSKVESVLIHGPSQLFVDLGTGVQSVVDDYYQNAIISLTTGGNYSVSGVASVTGSSAVDKVVLLDGNTAALTISAVETVTGSSGNDSVSQRGGGLFAVRGVETVSSSDGFTDTMKLLCAGSVLISGIESVLGSSGADSVTVAGVGDASAPVFFSAVENVLVHGPSAASLLIGSGVQSIADDYFQNAIITMTTALSLSISGIASVNGSAGVDRVTIADGNAAMTTFSLVESVIGSSGADNIVQAGGGNLALRAIETVSGSGNAVDTISLLSASSLKVYGIESVVGSSGVDTVTVGSVGDSSGGVFVSDVENVVVHGPSNAPLVIGTGVQTITDDYYQNAIVTLTTTSSLTISGVASITGSDGADTIVATGASGVTFTGGLGADHLTASTGIDVFVYNASNESDNSNFDVISNFNALSSDVIRLHLGLSSLSFIGAAAFSHTGVAEARFDDATKLLRIDVNGDGVSDMTIKLLGVNLSDLGASDFQLT